MKSIRKFLYKILGLEGYLRLVSRVYLWLIENSFLQKKYPELFFLKTVIKPGFICIDIGANLGYYSTYLSKYSGSKGKVYAVEPVPLFGKIWKDNVTLSMKKNLELLPYALGPENKIVTLSLPMVNGVLHHGMTKISDQKNENAVSEFEVQMKNPDELFSTITKLNFIKIDVEGYEYLVLSNMMQTIYKFKPMIQAELGGAENRNKVIELLTGIGYKLAVLKNNRLTAATEHDINHHQNDFYFTI